jgi:hypothetical protein
MKHIFRLIALLILSAGLQLPAFGSGQQAAPGSSSDRRAPAQRPATDNRQPDSRSDNPAALNKPPAANGRILPQAFAGWEEFESQRSADPGAADPANPALLKEFGFHDLESATYGRADGRKLTVKAARFVDASGAYGAFTFYMLPQMLKEEYGDEGRSLNERALFFRGSILVQATFDRTNAMSAAELRELAAALPLPGSAARNLPTLQQYLPKQPLANSVKYVEGPQALSAIGTPVPADQVGFDRGAEVAEGKYSTASGTATLMVISYPTPQIAKDREQAIKAMGANPPPAADASLAPPFTVKRAGPLVALVAGQVSAAEANSFLASIRYDADVTWNENTYFDRKNNVANLLVNVILLIAIIFGLALVAGFAFGGVRLLVKRFLPGKIFDRPEAMELIQLKLAQKPVSSTGLQATGFMQQASSSEQDAASKQSSTGRASASTVAEDRSL